MTSTTATTARTATTASTTTTISSRLGPPAQVKFSDLGLTKIGQKEQKSTVFQRLGQEVRLNYLINCLIKYTFTHVFIIKEMRKVRVNEEKSSISQKKDSPFQRLGEHQQPVSH